MKKVIIKMAVLAMLVCAFFSACTKESANNPKGKPEETNNTPRIIRSWSETDLLNENDSYFYNYHNAIYYQQELEYIDNMLAIYYPKSFSLESLPDDFCTFLPIVQPTIMYGIDSCGMVIMFENMDRIAAVKKLKAFNDIYAIQPVYKDFYNGTTNPGTIAPTLPLLSVEITDKSDLPFLQSMVDSLELRPVMMPGVNPNDPVSSLYYHFIVDHSPVNSVTAANMIYEAGNGRIKFSTPGWSSSIQ